MPDTITTVEGFVVVFWPAPHDTALMMARNINTTLAEQEGNHSDEEMVHAHASEGGEVPVVLSEVVGSGGH